MKKNTRIIVSLIISLMIIIFSIMIFMFSKNKHSINTNLTNSKNFAVYIEQGDGSYELSNSWPDSSYRLNKNKTICVDSIGNSMDNVISYNNGKIEFSTTKSVFCYFYFDATTDLIITVETDGKSNKLPSSKGYIPMINCDSGETYFNKKYHGIEISNFAEENKCNLSYVKDDMAYTNLKNKVESSTNLNSNGYRYSGKNPNNYIWFNNELWRIIGSIPTKQLDGTTENLIKIIRDNSIGNVIFDSNIQKNSQHWGNNSLYDLLNNHFYATNKNNLNGNNNDACKGDYERMVQPNCDYTTIGLLTTSYYGKMVKKVYWNTGASSTDVTPDTCYSNEIKNQTITGFVGLMSASDYGYSTSNEYISKNITLNMYGADIPSFGGSGYNNTMDFYASSESWLYKGNEYTITPYESSLIKYSLYIDYRGFIYYTMSANKYAGTDNGISVRPVVYLDKDVYIISGTGSISDPFIIGM